MRRKSRGWSARKIRYRLLPLATASRGQAAGALHSRTIEKSIAAAKNANTSTRFCMLQSWQRGAVDSKSPSNADITFSRDAHPIIMTSVNQVTIRKATSDDLEVGLICADRDGNRVRIDRVDRSAEILAYHFLNDELRVQEGIQELSIESFLAEGWYLV